MRWLGGALAALLASCDAQVDADYGGEPLVVLGGAIAAPIVVDVAEIVLRWDTADPRGPGEHESPTLLRTSFPSAFEAALLGLPPVAARLRCADGEPRFAEAYLFALDGARRTVGADFAHVLVWLEEDAPGGSATAAYLGAPLAAGFHVLTRSAHASPPAAQATLVEACRRQALAAGWDGARAATACAATRAYQLAPAPSGLEERWIVRTAVAP